MKKEFIDALAVKRSVYLDEEQSEIMANLLDTVSSDIYSQNIRFVFELIQNADDAGNESGNEVRFDFLDDALIVSHNGNPFEEKDISSLASAGKSQKEDDPNATGYKGIGFKSVFGRSKRVSIISDGYRFRFDKHVHGKRTPWQIVPVWTEERDLSAPITSVLKDEYAVSTVIEMKNAKDLQADLDEVLADGRILLFLRKVNKISVALGGEISCVLEKSLIEEHCSYKKIALKKDGEPLSTWLVQTFSNIAVPEALQQKLAEDEDTPPKLKKAKKTELSLAVSLDDQQIMPVQQSQSLLFTYLPTKVSSFQFPFLVNSNFLTNAPREALHEDHLWNEWLMYLTAEKLILWLAAWSNTDFKFQILKILPSVQAGSAGLKGRFNNELLRQIRETAFIPNAGVKLKRTSELIVDKTGLSRLEFIDRQAFIDFINREKGTGYAIDSFVHADVSDVDTLINYGALSYDIEHLQDFFLSEEFKNSHKTSDNDKLIEYFFDKANGSEGDEWQERLAKIPFIFSAEGNLKAPKAICFPGISYQTEFGDGVTLIHEEVYKVIQEKRPVIQWLESLGVKEPSEMAYIENEIIGNITNCSTPQNHLQLIRFLFRRFKDGVLTKDHLDQMQDIKIKTTKVNLESAKLCFLSDFYQPELRLETVNDACHFVSPEYWQQGDLTSEWKTFLIKLGVAEKIEQTCMNLDRAEARTKYNAFVSFFDSNSTLRYVSRAGWVHYNTITNYKLQSYSLLEFATEYAFSKVFWDQIFKTNFRRQSSDEGEANYYDTPYLKDNFFEWSLAEMALIPTRMKTCEKASDVFINDQEIIEISGAYLPVLDHERPLSDDWRKLLKLKTSLSLSDYLHILEQMAVAHDRTPITRADQRRLGLIYNKLGEMMPNLSPENEVLIKDWATKNRLPSTSLNFENVDTLKLVSIASFSTSTDTLKVMLLPENSRPNLPEFKKLIELLGIPEINSYVPDFGTEDPKHNVALKNKLLSILPYLALVVAKKQYEDFLETFKKMHKNLVQTDFYVVQSARLTFQNGQETFSGPELNTYKDQFKLYFKGDWQKPLVLYSLLPELLTIFQVRGFSEELRLLLAIERADIEEHFITLGLDINSTAFISAVQSIQPELAEEVIEPAEEAYSGFQSPPFAHSTSSHTGTRNDQNDVYDVDEREEFETPFTPTSDATDTTVPTVIRNRSYDQGIQIQTATVANYRTMEDQKSRDEVGRWSEEKVYTILSKEGRFADIVWVNKDVESKLPYDISYSENGHKRYIDVKGTPSPVKEIVYLSGPEWAFMFATGGDYSIYRVFNAGKEDAIIEIINNPANLILTDKIRPEKVSLQL
ncbi:sacsin N-terminal ATP-binding-like domain-containing protein [Mucilaginibacter myungsuensis]|uniref:DUF3883 domain-containing protein n=1 Tax=Mucilaginibacter myungsuensis TaxID=649104 RepID=A0A929PXE1_9SPHI|nr:DUF3883 domain-containing protein [Mucilaginibacter myungsuensis]MBE9663081.1 DUF3883 domain-containing protein [Mucilaginibacter myungsuensis]MDN3598716.1 DUF3883 domain-containing protein [Mucilaginibacter myungsuensis]